jgi:NADH:ubiquinone oxidoreductase subunit 5 (subunit L)/multisubunit Na+/H+ antiporter MnhA subunit
MHDDENMHKYFAYLNLFIFFMITLVIGSNLLVLSSVGKVLVFVRIFLSVLA